jgi:YVTN family beta-propeller protein
MSSIRWPVVAATALAICGVILGGLVVELVRGDDEPVAATTDEPGSPAAAGGREPEPAQEATSTTRAPGPPADTLRLRELTTISGDISPKSVVASGTGIVTAQNMMYRHTVTAYDADGTPLATVPDRVTLSDFGIDKPGEYQGAPVEAAFVRDGSAVYVSNYSMYGPGFREGSDDCTPASDVPPSYLYRIDTSSWEIDQVVPVGAVPKYVALTPDDERVLTTNWCSWDMTVSSSADGVELARIPLGRYPRGIAVSPDGAVAYVAIMGETRVARVDLEDYSVSWIEGVGVGPRHLVLSPDGRHLYVSNNKGGTVSKVDTATGEVLAEQRTGSQPRSMDISTDGTAVYVVNYDSSTMSKLDTDDLHLLQEVPTGGHPIGITFDDLTGRVWVANYTGTIDVYEEVGA